MVTAAREGSRRVVASADKAAARIGIRPGQAVAQAQASVPGLVVVEADPAGDAIALGQLTEWCLRASPVVQADPPDGILIDVAGATHLFGGEQALMLDLVHRIERAGFSTRAALADTPGAAWGLARFGPDGIVPTGSSKEVVSLLPIAALRLPTDTGRALAMLGIERIGHLDTFSRAQLTLRFGSILADRHARVLGLAPDPLTPHVVHEQPRARIAFPEPLADAGGIGAALSDLAENLCRELARREEGLRQLDAVLRRVDGLPLGIRIGTAMPTRDPVHCGRLLVPRLDGIDPGFGIDEIVLVASRTEPLRERQLATAASTDFEASDPARLAGLIDRLGSRVGAEHVFRAEPVESRVPERSVRRVPPLAPRRGATWPATLPRPSRIIDPPEPVRALALLPDYPPTSFIWRRVRHVVRSADGPERVHGEWWRSDSDAAEMRDYYRVEDTRGRRFWLYRNAPSPSGTQWWLHGRFG